MAAASHFSKTARYMLGFSQLALIVSLLDLLPFPLSLILIRFAPCILFFSWILDIPRGDRKSVV